jgi:membrane protease YdiL (CAAX protease family)
MVLFTTLIELQCTELAQWLKYLVLGLIRTTQAIVIIWMLLKWENGFATIGWAPAAWGAGLRKGAIWSLAFAAIAGLGMLAVHLAGENPLHMIRQQMPPNRLEMGLFFMLAGIVAPVAEEIFFRGILYTFFRRWGIVCALLASTAIFVVLHAPRGIPYTQIVGGLVFALAYETTGNLTVPITIHCLGNIAIFSLSLL